MQIQWTSVKKPIKELKTHERNPRKISGDALKKLEQNLDHYGMAADPTINLDGTIIGGHQRVKALKNMKVKEVVVKVPSRLLDPAEVKKLNVILNRTAGEFDTDILGSDFEMAELVELGFQPEELKFLDGQTKEIEEDEGAEELPPEPQSKLGHLYELGKHRLICGSSADALDVDKVMKQDKVNVVVTDPPYGVDYNSKNEMLNKYGKGNANQKHIENDSIKDYRKFFTEFLSLIPLADYNCIYSFMLGSELHNLRLAFDDCNIKWADYLIWVKNNHVLGRKDYNCKHEFIIYGWKGKHKFFAKEHRVTILKYDKPTKNDLHPTMKPIKLLAQLITDGSNENGIVYDAFGGSGSTLIAAEQTNRRCYMIEIDPGYCDVIVKRWIKQRQADGKDYAVLRNGEPCSDFS